jgi:hypothetical protein
MLSVMQAVRPAGRANASCMKYMHILYHIKGICFIIICVRTIVYAFGCIQKHSGSGQAVHAVLLYCSIPVYIKQAMYAFR